MSLRYYEPACGFWSESMGLGHSELRFFNCAMQLGFHYSMQCVRTQHFLVFGCFSSVAVGIVSILSFTASKNAGTNDNKYVMPLILQECRFRSNGKVILCLVSPSLSEFCQAVAD